MGAEVMKTILPYAGIGGLALLVFYYLLRDIISKNIFTNLSDHQSYSLLRWILIAIWSVTVVGIIAWAYTGKRSEPNTDSNLPPNRNEQPSLSPTPRNASTPSKSSQSPIQNPIQSPTPRNASTPSKSSQSPIQNPIQMPYPGSPIQMPSSKQRNIITHNTAESVGNGQWRWTVFLITDAETHAEIDCVEYTLHPTFPNPERRVCAPSDDFALTGTGWGTFEIKVRVVFKDGTEKRLTHMLKFV